MAQAGAVFGVAQQAAHGFVVLRSELGWDGNVLVHLLAQPAQGIGVDQAHARRLGVVLTSAMEHRTQIEQEGALGHNGLHGFGMLIEIVVDQVAAQHNTGGAVCFREVTHGPHDVDLELDAGDAQGIDRVIGMEHLMTFAWMNLDAGIAADPVAQAMGFQERIGHGEYQRMGNHLRRGRRITQRAGNAQGLVAVEVVFGVASVAVEFRAHLGGTDIDGFFIHHVGHDRRAGVAQGLDQIRMGNIAVEICQFHGHPPCQPHIRPPFSSLVGTRPMSVG